MALLCTAALLLVIVPALLYLTAAFAKRLFPRRP
jgi:hypothetical protein